MQRNYHIQHPGLRAFFAKATLHIQQTNSPCIIRQGEPEFAAWVDYFDRVVGQRPIVLQAAIANQERVFTVPAKWPEWFDTQAALAAPQAAE